MKHNKFNTLAAAVAVATTGLTTSVPIMAASAILEEVVVVARKKAESVQDIPISVAALSSGAIKKAVIEDVTDLGRVVTGLVAQRNNQGGGPVYALRGTKTENRIDGGVTLYLDDMPLLDNFAAENAFFDIATVEVLKGPQGTQFGANTTGGTISIRAEKPTEEFEAYVEAGISNYSGRSLEAMVNVPLTDWALLRVAGKTLKRDGLIDNVEPAATRGSVPGDFNDEDYYTYRVSLRLTNNDNITSDFIYDYHEQDTNGRGPQRATGLASTPLVSPLLWGAQLSPSDTSDVSVGVDPNSGVSPGIFTYNENWGIQNVTIWDINGNWTLRNVIGYREDEDHLADHNDGTNVFLANVYSLQDYENFVDDFTLTWNSDDDDFSIAVGGYYQDTEKSQASNGIVTENFGLAGFYFPFTGPVTSYTTNEPRNENTYKAVYANIEYALTDTLKLQVGGRRNWDEVKFFFRPARGFVMPYTFKKGDFFGPGPVGTPGVDPVWSTCSVPAIEVYENVDLASCTGSQTEKFTANSYNIGISSQFSDDSMIYAKASSGYLVGGVNSGFPSELLAYQPEKTRTFEGGVKSDWELGGRPIRTNLTAFYGDSKNKQQFQLVTIFQNPGQRTQPGVFNAALLNFYGFEADILYNIAEGLEVSLAWTHMETEYENFKIPAIPNTPITKPLDFSDRTPAQMPEDTVSVSLSYEWPLSSDIGVITSTISGYYTSSYTIQDIINLNDVFGTAVFTEEDNKVDSYDVWRFYLSWENIFGSDFEANFWVDNLFDDEYIIKKDVQATLGYKGTNYGDPRTFGLNVRYNF